MSIAKLKTSDTPDVKRAEDGIESIIREAIGREPFFYFPRVSDSPGQLVQFLHGFDPQGVSNVYSGLNIYIFGGSCSKSFVWYKLYALDINWIEACTNHVMCLASQIQIKKTPSRSIDIYLD